MARTDALADYRRKCELEQRDQDYPRFFIWLIQVRLGEKVAADKELAKYLEKRSGDWPSKIGAFLLDKSSEADFFAAAASPDEKKERGQLCEAWFYAGMKKLNNGNKKTAAEYFRKCIATEEKNRREYKLAVAELKILGE